MDKHNAKYLGEIELSVEENGYWADFVTAYEGQEITVSFSGYNHFGDAINTCWKIIDKYIELNKIVKKTIIENFPQENGCVNNYFKYHFSEDMMEEEKLAEVFGVKRFEQIEIGRIVGKMDYPNIIFFIKDGKITFYAEYKASKYYSDELLSVQMDEEMNVLGFIHES
jgi:hypothetical protein